MTEKQYNKNLDYLKTHKPSFMGYYSHRAYDTTDEYCASNRTGNCSECVFKQWCNYEPWLDKAILFIKFIPFRIQRYIFSPLFTFYWRHFRKGKFIVCSNCGLKDNLKKYSLDEIDYKLTKNGWLCHHCQWHANDDWAIDKGKIPHEEFEKNWQDFVKKENARMENE